MGNIQFMNQIVNEPTEEEVETFNQQVMQQNSLELVRHIAPSINDHNAVDEKIRKHFWGLLSPGASSTFNQENDKIDFDLNMTALRLSHLMNQEPSKVNCDDIIQVDNVYVEAQNNFKRSVGGRGGRTNFLNLMFTNIQERISRVQNNQSSGGSPMRTFDNIRRGLFG